PSSTLFPYTTLFRSGEERHLQRRALDEHARVPGEAVALVEEHGVDVRQRLGQRGQAEAEGAEADADEVVDVGHQPSPSVRARRGDRKSTRLNSSHVK